MRPREMEDMGVGAAFSEDYWGEEMREVGRKLAWLGFALSNEYRDVWRGEEAEGEDGDYLMVG